MKKQPQVSFVILAVMQCDSHMTVGSLENASDPEPAQRVEGEHTTTTMETEAISSGLEEDIEFLQTKLGRLTRAVVTNHEWLLQDANHRTEMIIMAWQQMLEEYHSAILSLEQIEEAEAQRISRIFYEACGCDEKASGYSNRGFRLARTIES